MRSSPTGAVRAEPNVTPMIDVMLVLLVIFMLVVPALVSGTTAVPPQGANFTTHPDGDDETLAIDRRGRYFLRGQPIDRTALPDALRAIFAARTTDRVLYVRADRELDYATVRDAMAVATAAGVHVAALVTEAPSRP